MKPLRTLVRRILVAVLALVLLFEEWGWEPLAALVGRLAKRFARWYPRWKAWKDRIMEAIGAAQWSQLMKG